MDQFLSADSNSLKIIVSLSDDELAQVPLELLNLICASGLPGSEELDIAACDQKLDQWADEVRHETQRNWYRFLRDPDEYENSAAYFRILVMITVLQRDLGCMYNPERVKDETFQDPFAVNPNFSDARDLFIHGILFGSGGTCASMPVLYVSVGRRLGYPLKLVEAKGHLFCRWDDKLGEHHPPERFNIEGSGLGFGMYPDEHYAVWPMELTDIDLNENWYLKSLTPRQELAVLLSLRGACLTDNERFAEALECFDWCRRLTGEGRYEWLLLKEQDRFNAILAERHARRRELHDLIRLAEARRQAINDFNRRTQAQVAARMQPSVQPGAGMNRQHDPFAFLDQSIDPITLAVREQQQRIRENNLQLDRLAELAIPSLPPSPYAGRNIPTH